MDALDSWTLKIIAIVIALIIVVPLVHFIGEMIGAMFQKKK